MTNIHNRSNTRGPQMNEIDKKKDVFISYAHEDIISNFIKELELFLDEHGITYHIDTQWQPDAKPRICIDKAFKNSRKILCVVTHAYMEKPYTDYEREIAFDKAIVKRNEDYVIPLMCESRDDNWLTHCNAIDFTQRSKAVEMWPVLLGRIRPELQEASLEKDTMPLPDEDVTSFTNRPLQALPIGEDIAHPKWPFDLGTVWGLERGSFIGLVAGREEDGLYETLKRAERTLYTVERETGLRAVFPTRWWIRADFEKFPDGPSDERQIWEAAQEAKNTMQVRYLRIIKLVEGLIPGFFFELPHGRIGRSLPIVKSWCDAIFNTIFPSRQPSLIVHVTSGSTEDCVEAVHRLAEALAGVTSVKPQKMRLLDAFLTQSAIKDKNTSTGIAFSPKDIQKPKRELLGLDFCICAYQMMRTQNGKKDLVPFENGEKRYPLVYQTLEKLWEACSDYLEELQENEIPEISGAKVVRDLQKNLPDQEAPFHDEFLQMTKTYLPQRLPEMIRAYATSQSKEAGMRALFVALSFEDCEHLVDAWIDASGLEEHRRPGPEDFRGAPRTGDVPPLTQYVIGLLRALQNRRIRQRALEAISDLRQQIIGALARVCDFCTEEVNEGQNANEWGADECFFALRAGAGERIQEIWLNFCHLDQPYIWWGLGALAPNPALFRGLYAMEPEKRAVFGLCNREELLAVFGDSRLEQKIKECRRNRPV